MSTAVENNDNSTNGNTEVKDVWNARRDSTRKISSAALPLPSDRRISTLDWPSLSETIEKVTKLTIDEVKPSGGSSSGSSGGSGKDVGQGPTDTGSTDSGEEPPELWKESSESWGDSTPPPPDTHEDEPRKVMESRSSEGEGQCSSISIETTPASPPPKGLAPSERRKSSKGSKLKWIPLPLPDLPPLKQRTGRRPSSKRSDRGKENGNNEFHHPNSPHENRRKMSPRAAARAAAGKGKLHPSRRVSEATVMSSSSSINGDFPDFGVIGQPIRQRPSVDFFMPYFGHGNNYSQQPFDDHALIGLIRNQIEYYFGDENLSRDFFLRRKMDSEGYLPVHLIASFHRVQKLTTDFELVLAAIHSSSILEVKDGCIRTIFDPLRWPILDNIPMSPVGLIPAHSRSYSLPMCGIGM